MLRFYVEVARTAFRRQLIYRSANLAGLLTNIVFGIIFSYVMIALFQSQSNAGGYDLNDALRYVWLVQSMVMIVLTFGWYELMLTIRSGEVVSDLSKPCDFYQNAARGPLALDMWVNCRRPQARRKTLAISNSFW